MSYVGCGATAGSIGESIAANFGGGDVVVKLEEIGEVGNRKAWAS